MKKLLLSILIWTVGLGYAFGQQPKSFNDKKKEVKQLSGSPNLQSIKVPKLKRSTGRSGYSNAKTTKPLSITPLDRTALEKGQVQYVKQKTSKTYDHQILRTSDSGIPIFIKSQVKISKESENGHSQTKVPLGTYWDDVAPLLKMDYPDVELVEKHRFTDNKGMTHIKLQQQYKGIKVYGAEMILHLDTNNQVDILNGRSIPTPKIASVQPLISADEAMVNARASLSTFTEVKELEHPWLKSEEQKAELLIYQHKNIDPVLVWRLNVFPNLMERWVYFVNAADGSIVDKYYHTCTFAMEVHEDHYSKGRSTPERHPFPPESAVAADLNGVNRQINTFNINGIRYLLDTSKPMYNPAQSDLPDNGVGVIMTVDMRNEPAEAGVDIFHITSSSNNWNNPTAVSAHYNADVSYEYFRNTFNRNSINGQGGNIISVINVGGDNGDGLDNAFWNGAAMFYGNGDVAFSSLAAALDVGGHEMSHGVIQNTANLEYRDQPGAINESMADIFGAMIDRDDWLLGEDIVNTNIYRSGALRNMEDPHNGGNSLSDIGWQPSHLTEYTVVANDNGGVHVNSGIPNKAYYNFATAIGKDKAEQAFYRALSVYLTVSSQFIDLRLAVIQSAEDLYGEGSQEAEAAGEAFDEVGIFDGESSDTGDDVPVSEGDEFILSYDINANDENTLYISSTLPDNYVPVSQTMLSRKPSVSDDGSLALYITDDNRLGAIDLDSGTESILGDEQVWGNVAISKDGTKLAAVSSDVSNLILVLDFETNEIREFELYNPTTAEGGAATGDVLYADALEWDYSGEYVMYDALNAIKNANGDDIEYWDVGFLKVWDNENRSFGDGVIQKLFTGLPDGINIGNPSFSKTSGNIVAFDLFDNNTGRYQVLTANIETSDVVVVIESGKLGFPNYSRLDDQLIYDDFDAFDEEVINIIDLNSDKISPVGVPELFIPLARWGIWYTRGNRQLLSDEKDINSYLLNQLTPRISAMITGNSIDLNVPEGTDVTNLVAFFTNSNDSRVSVNGIEQLSGVTANDFSTPIIYTVTAEDGSTRNYTTTVTVGTETITGIDDELSSDGLNIYPNPVGDRLFIEYKINKNVKVKLSNALGQEVQLKPIGAATSKPTQVLDLRDLPSGIYLLRLESDDGSIVRRVLKN